MDKREDIERAIKHISDNVCFLTRNNGSEESVAAHKIALTALKDKLHGMENEDVVEVVRCRNCQHIEKIDDEQKALFDTDAEYYCNHLDCPVDGNGFCSAGKRG